MDTARKIELINQQIEKANGGAPLNFEEWRTSTETVLRKVMGEGSPAWKNFMSVDYEPGVYTLGMDMRPYRAAGVRTAIDRLNSAVHELILEEEFAEEVSVVVREETGVSPAPVGKQVFVVHGHDGERKHEVARFIKNLTGDEPVILHEQADDGQVLIEKFEASAAKTGYAVVLLTADDLGRAKSAAEEQSRARQNVVFEMGFFFGAIGRSRVTVLRDADVEDPGDIQGFVYTPLDRAGAWKMTVARNMQSAGLDVDWSALGKG